MFITKLKRLGHTLIPGIITGGADNDPSGITTYSIAGASFGYGQLWLMVWAMPMLIAVQSMCARLGKIYKKGLIKIIREEFSPALAWGVAIAVVVANVATIGADLVAISASIELISGVWYGYWIVPVTLLLGYIIIFKNYRTITKWMLLLMPFFLLYVIAGILASPDWYQVLRNVVLPSWDEVNLSYAVACVALLGTTIAPYLFFWQVREEVEQHLSKARAEYEARHEDWLISPGIILSQIVTMFIIIAAGATIHGSGSVIVTAADAAAALKPVAGPFASYLFAIGIVGTGIMALPVLTASTAYVVAEAASWRKQSLSDTFSDAKPFYTVILLALFSGIVFTLFKVDPIKALFYSQVGAGVLVPFILVLIIYLSNQKSIMGQFRSGWFDNFFGTMAALVMFAAVGFLFVGLL